jgi:hypothetical protein
MKTGFDFFGLLHSGQLDEKAKSEVLEVFGWSRIRKLHSAEGRKTAAQPDAEPAHVDLLTLSLEMPSYRFPLLHHCSPTPPFPLLTLVTPPSLHFTLRFHFSVFMVTGTGPNFLQGVQDQRAAHVSVREIQKDPPTKAVGNE